MNPDVAQVANSPIMWIMAASLILLVIIQSSVFFIVTSRHAEKHQILTATERRKIVSSAMITSIGPAVAIFIMAIPLIVTIGGPMTLMRIGVIGSAYFENYAASQGAIAAGAELGKESFTLKAFSSSVWAMVLGGGGWLVATLLMTKHLRTAQGKAASIKPLLIPMMSCIVPSAIFITASFKEFFKRNDWHDLAIKQDALVAALVAAAAMVILIQLGKKQSWLREWALGLAMILGILAGAAYKSYRPPAEPAPKAAGISGTALNKTIAHNKQ